jgi:two-component system phosphate regulon sensor histidine kinase PhoR
MIWNKNNPKVIALITTLSIVVVAAFTSLITLQLWGQEWFILYGITFLIFFVFVYFIIYQTLDRFIYSKIKLIYKTIHRLKLGKESLVQHYESNIESLEDVSKEVEDWAKSQSEEIASLKATAQYRREFLGNVSHELRTPIFNIQGYIMTLLDGGLDDPEINVKYLKRTVKSIERMIEMVDDLETISALESGELALKKENFNLIEFVGDIIEHYEDRAGKLGINIFIANLEKHPPIYVEADMERIRQVFSNLIDNAIKYMGNAQNPRVKISFYDMDENVLVEVSDNGIGIAEENIPRLFERFYRVDKGRSRESGGTGLGLAIVKHIIEAHKQTINVRSTLGVGTTFSFTLKQLK